MRRDDNFVAAQFQLHFFGQAGLLDQRLRKANSTGVQS